MKRTTYIGCAGWSMPAAERERFGAGDSVLARYATRFNAVEINSSFYRSHKPDTYRRWSEGVPKGFRFAVKLPRAITHDARLVGTGPLLDAFLGEVAGLGKALGVLLVQLPPSLAYDGRQASAFVRALRRRHDGRVAIEPRHRTWFEAPADALLLAHGIARVAADPALVDAAAVPGGARDWSYWRWHGSPRMYYSEYGDARLAALAAAIQARRDRETWCVFDNTASGAATRDALSLAAQFDRDATLSP